MDNKFASICVLAYKRPLELEMTLKSIIKNTKFPYELIINNDGDDQDNIGDLIEKFLDGRISKLIFNNGKNATARDGVSSKILTPSLSHP